mmetsp:Transcript_24272/g.26963  ORF Transcript_24272/g.26963 Transcript_24272/m.26963 type:complete len:228 (+) Transcript_24272:104-787(+)
MSLVVRGAASRLSGLYFVNRSIPFIFATAAISLGLDELEEYNVQLQLQFRDAHSYVRSNKSNSEVVYKTVHKTTPLLKVDSKKSVPIDEVKVYEAITSASLATDVPTSSIVPTNAVAAPIDDVVAPTSAVSTATTNTVKMPHILSTVVKNANVQRFELPVHTRSRMHTALTHSFFGTQEPIYNDEPVPAVVTVQEERVMSQPVKVEFVSDDIVRPIRKRGNAGTAAY